MSFHFTSMICKSLKLIFPVFSLIIASPYSTHIQQIAVCVIDV